MCLCCVRLVNLHNLQNALHNFEIAVTAWCPSAALGMATALHIAQITKFRAQLLLCLQLFMPHEEHTVQYTSVCQCRCHTATVHGIYCVKVTLSTPEINLVRPVNEILSLTQDPVPLRTMKLQSHRWANDDVTFSWPAQRACL